MNAFIMTDDYYVLLCYSDGAVTRMTFAQWNNAE